MMPPDSPGPVLELIGVTAAYGRIEVLHGIDLIVPQGSVVALLGPNGAGKSTTIKIAGGQLIPRSGCLHVAGRHVNGATPDSLARAGVCTIPEGRGIFPNLTVRENLHMATYSGAQAREIEERTYARFPVLAERRSQFAGTLSGGEQQMLAVARAIAGEPALLMLDEISMGLAPRIVAELYELVANIAAQGVSILLVEQYAHMALAVADYVAVMVQGRIKAMGEPGDVEEELERAYFGAAA
jgi:branched-chain amino acid transport system ATP-binding protein